MHSSEEPTPTIEIIKEYDHYRWVCSCGSKGIRLCFRQSVVPLSIQHLQKIHNIPPKSPTKDQRIIALEEENKRLMCIVVNYGGALLLEGKVTINDFRRACGLQEIPATDA